MFHSLSRKIRVCGLAGVFGGILGLSGTPCPAAFVAIDPADYAFGQSSVNVNYLNNAGHRALEITATVTLTNNTGATFEGVRFVWAWGIGYHLYNAQPDEIFERRWDESAGRFLYDGHDSFYDGEAGTAMEVLGTDGLMPFSETSLDPHADAEDFTWLGVNTGEVPLSAYPDLYVDPTSAVPYQVIGDVLSGETVNFQISSRTEYPNDPIPNGLGIWGMPSFLQISTVPEPAMGLSLALGIAAALWRRRIS